MILLSNLPAGPTNGLPSVFSDVPGASPMNRISAGILPLAKTILFLLLHNVQRTQFFHFLQCLWYGVIFLSSWLELSVVAAKSGEQTQFDISHIDRAQNILSVLQT